jgi:pSer/pThr/pTyr-binding forkhead associated (FHA) protein
MLGKLLPNGGGPPIPLLKPRLLVGRQSFCDIPIAVASISSRHCELELVDGYWHVRDLDSSNGTRINGVRCPEGWLLPNDVLGIASRSYTIAYTPPAGRPPPNPVPPPTVLTGAPPARSRPAPATPPTPRAGNPPARASMGELLPCGGGPPIALTRPRLLVGRQPGCDLVLAFGSVSGRHCELELVGGYWNVRDLDSRNGIRVNGVRCKAARLEPGCVLGIANFRYRVIYGSQMATPAEVDAALFSQGLLEKAGLTGWRPKAVKEEKEERQRLTLDEDE